MAESGGSDHVCGSTDTNSGDPCQFPVQGPDDQCYMHPDDGSGPPDGHGQGDYDDTMPAMSNGGGAPEGNKNGLEHGLYAVQNDPSGTLDWMEDNQPAAYDWVVRTFQGYLDVAPFDGNSSLAETLLLLTIYEWAARQGLKEQVSEGLLQLRQVKDEQTGELKERLDANPINLEVDRIIRTLIRGRKELAVLPGPVPDRQSAQAEQDMAEAAKRLADRSDADIIDVGTD